MEKNMLRCIDSNIKLGIIIPAYKIDYLNQTLASIKSQTNNKFRLYVFDDNSPYDIKSCFDDYFSSNNNAIYIKFDNNLGQINLASHWNRCINYVKEEWIWIFSDDDIMSPICVEEFYNTIHKKKDKIKNVLRFNSYEINDNIIKKKPQYPQKLYANDFFKLLYSRQIDARMPEFIFRREKLLEIGGIQNFDLAWRSDNATVISMTFPSYIYTIERGEILWRLSENNISGNKKEKIINRKNKATVAFFNWIHSFYKENFINYEMPITELFHIYMLHTEPINNCISWKKILKDSFNYSSINSVYKWLLFIYMFYIFKRNNNF